MHWRGSSFDENCKQREEICKWIFETKKIPLPLESILALPTCRRICTALVLQPLLYDFLTNETPYIPICGIWKWPVILTYIELRHFENFFNSLIAPNKGNIWPHKQQRIPLELDSTVIHGRHVVSFISKRVLTQVRFWWLLLQHAVYTLISCRWVNWWVTLGVSFYTGLPLYKKTSRWLIRSLSCSLSMC